MLIDCHVHDNKYSADSILDLYEAIEQAKKIGLDAICITNHDNNALRNEIGDSAVINDLLVIVGAEILTFEGDIVIFGVEDELPDKMISAEALLTFVQNQGGVSFAAHPFRDNNRGIGKNIIRLAQLLTGVEAFNGSTSPEHNLEAYNLALELALPTLGASDAHNLEKLGTYATRFKDRIRDHLDFIEALQGRDYRPVMKQDRGFVDINEAYS